MGKATNAEFSRNQCWIKKEKKQQNKTKPQTIHPVPPTPTHLNQKATV